MGDLEKITIERMKLAANTSEKFYGKPLAICYSGGKDSEIILELAIRAGINFEAVNNHTTADAPETVRHIRKRFYQLEQNGKKAVIRYPIYKGASTSMWNLIPQKKLPPTRTVRYCCQVLKETFGPGRAICTGVRSSESARRAGRAFFEKPGETRKKVYGLNVDDAAQVFDEIGDRKMLEHCYQKRKAVFNPIIDWSNSDVWEYITAEKLDINPLYMEGWARVGCIGCPLAGKTRLKEFIRWPKYKDLYMCAFRKLIANIQQDTERAQKEIYKSAEHLFRWWMEDDTINGQLKMTDDGIIEERW